MNTSRSASSPTTACPCRSGRVAATPAEAVAAARELPGPVWVVKAQVHAGGRGKAGGVKLCRSAEEVGKAAKAMLGERLVTPQTGAAGLPVNLVYVESGSAIERELYLSLLLDRERSRIAFVASAAGGMNIEEVAAHEPEKILRVDVDPAAGLQGTSAAGSRSASGSPASRSPSSSASRARCTGCTSSAISRWSRSIR